MVWQSVPAYRYGRGPTDLPTPKDAPPPPPSKTGVGKMLEDMHWRRVIEESDSPWLSPVVLVRKKSRDLHFSVDYRKLKGVTKKDCFPLLWIDDTLNHAYPRQPVECLFATLPLSLKCSYYLLMLLSSGGLTLYSCRKWTNSNNGFKFCIWKRGLCFLLYDSSEHIIRTAVW
jgi:hypothetical protein